MLGEHIPPHYSYWPRRFSDEEKAIFCCYDYQRNGARHRRRVVGEQHRVGTCKMHPTRWMLVSTVKHGLPRTVMNNSPYYITSNALPNFGKDDENFQRRIEIFTTQSLPRIIPAIDRWMYDHAMDCITWISEEINANRDRIDPNELWYEESNTLLLTIASNEGESLFDREKITQISYADLCGSQVHALEEPQSSATIHEGFLA